METTDTILEKMQQNAPENIIIHMDKNRYLVSVKIVKLLSWGLIPDFLKDENSKEAKEHPILRTGLKRLVAPVLPKILLKTWGEEVEIKPRLNVLTWLPTYAIHFVINLLATKEWRFHVENCEGCGDGVYRIVGISPNTDGILSPPAVTTNETSDRESLQRGGQSDPSGETDSNLLRGSVGGSGRPQEW